MKIETDKVSKPCSSTLEVTKTLTDKGPLVLCNYVTQNEEQKADSVAFAITYFTKDEDAHFPLKKSLRI